MTSRVDVIAATLLDRLSIPNAPMDVQGTANAIHEALNDWERKKHSSNRHEELAVGVARRLFGHNAPAAVIGNAANILMSLGGSGLAAIIQAVDEYDARATTDKSKKVADALMRKPAVLVAVIHELRQRGVKVAGPWVWASADMLYRQGAPQDYLAAQVKRLHDNSWEWVLEVRAGQSGSSGRASTVKRAADQADEMLEKRRYTLVGGSLPDPEEAGHGTE